MSLVFVTGSTGLLGNNLVRALVANEHQVRALARSRAKAEKQLGGLAGVEIVVGDMADVAAFAPALQGCATLFHTAAYFRDSYKGGNHARALEQTNVDGTRNLLEAAYAAGVRKMVHTSSIAVLAPSSPGASIDETSLRPLERADDYYGSKIRSERVVTDFLADHTDFDACIVLPGWMCGPGDIGPTSSGQMILDVVAGKVPGLPPGTFSLTDARDVARAMMAAASSGRRGERYLATGTTMSMRELIPLIGTIAGVKTPTWQVPFALLYVLAVIQELGARLFGKPALLSMATVRLMQSEGDDSANYDLSKSHRELGYTVRPPEQTIGETLAWYREHGFLGAATPSRELVGAG